MIFTNLLLSLILGFVLPCTGFVPSCTRLVDVTTRRNGEAAAEARVEFTVPSFLSSKKDADDDDGDGDGLAPDLGDEDWRAFRAKLVMGESSTPSSAPVDEDDLDGLGALFSSDFDQSTESSKKKDSPLKDGMTPLDPSQWAYEAERVIEQGAVILGGVEQNFGFGLRQQYFHKAAILVLDHQDTVFTKGIVLNRPTDLLLEDDMNPGAVWRVWFGGDVQGLNSPNPDIICLHSLHDNEQVAKASVPVMKDIQWTSFDNAKLLVKKGVAQPSDFWVFSGYAGWGPNQLMGELERKSWYMVATDSQTLLKELAREGERAEPREAGLDTWDLLMGMIGRGETADKHTGGFDDLMLKEWALKNLLSTQAGGGAGEQHRDPEGVPPPVEIIGGSDTYKNELKNLIKQVAAVSRGEDVTEGTLVRASPVDRSPFLLENQELHKSIVLIILDNEEMTVGAILNRPTAKGLDIQITEKDSGKKNACTLPLRFGGQYAVKGSEPFLWLHCLPALRAKGIGDPVGLQQDGIWKCTAENVISSIGLNLATPEDFVVVSGVSVWIKGQNGLSSSMQKEIESGNFEVVPSTQTEAVWNTLRKQEGVLTSGNLKESLGHADEAWSCGSTAAKRRRADDDGLNVPPIGGLGEGYDEEDDSLVFKSDVKVAKLSDDALRSWVSTFLLGMPNAM